QPGGEIGRVADDRLLLRRALAHEIADDDEAGRYADAHGELLAGAGLQARHNRGDFQTRVDRPRRVILVRAGKAEIGQHAVSHELGDETVIASDRAGAGVLNVASGKRYRGINTLALWAAGLAAEYGDGLW